MDARTYLWNCIYDLKFKEFFIEKYICRARRIDAIISAASALVTIAAVSLWTILGNWELILSVALLIAQLVQSTRQYLPYSRRISALTYLLLDLRVSNLQAEKYWWQHQNANNEQTNCDDLAAKVFDLKSEFAALESRYLGSDHLPRSTRLNNLAQKELDIFIRLSYINDKEV